MAGCGGGTCGIQAAREAERQRVRELLARVYPDGTCVEGPLSEMIASGLDLESCRDLAARITDVLPVRVVPVPAAAEGLGDVLYLLVGLHEPCLLELREGMCARDAAMLRRRETYLKVFLSPLGRFATLQETVLELEDLGDGARLVTENPQAGVENRDLRMLVTGLQGMLRKARIVLLDFAFLLQRYDETAGDPAFAARWATDPTLWSLLFDPAPPTTSREVVV
jgi:hypothetical protein